MNKTEFAKGEYLLAQGMYTLNAALQIESIQFDVRVGVDTGFSGSIFLPMEISRRLERSGIIGYSEPLILADGSRIEAKTYIGFLKKISNYEFEPSISMPVFCYGQGDSLIGIELLNRWISEFHGPKNKLTLFWYHE